MYNEALIMIAWAAVKPEPLMIEINKAIARLGISERFFTFKIITPVYPPQVERLTDPDYYKKNEFDWKKVRAIEK